jgi:hypothetical protein
LAIDAKRSNCAKCHQQPDGHPAVIPVPDWEHHTDEAINSNAQLGTGRQTDTNQGDEGKNVACPKGNVIGAGEEDAEFDGGKELKGNDCGGIESQKEIATAMEGSANTEKKDMNIG